MDIGDFFQLQRAFEGNREMDAASEEECAVFLGEFLRPSSNLRLEVEGVLHTAGQLAQFFDIGVRLFFGY